MAKRIKQKHLCVRCGNKALFLRPRTGKLVARKDHDLCQRCFRSDCDSARAEQLKQPKKRKRPRRRGKNHHVHPATRVVSVINPNTPSSLSLEKTT